jgi:anaerobic magnesium-protoporphyrin IX monomethyl ester cyclase
MNSKRVFCIVPPTGRYVREDRCQTPISKLKTIALRTPIDLLYCGAAFEAVGCKVKIVDYPAKLSGGSWQELEQDLIEFSPDIALLSITTLSIDEDLKAARLIKQTNPQTIVAAKGAHFTTLDLKSLECCPELDLVLRGEYENTAMDLGKGIPLSEIAGITWRTDNGEIIRNRDREFEDNLDSFPTPARHLLDNSRYIRPDTGAIQTTIVTNRGCPFHCIYCLANQVAGTKNRYRSVESVMREIRECVELHGIRDFLFRSELFTQSTSWVKNLCEAIVDSKLKIAWACNSRVDSVTPEMLHAMKQAGCWIIAFGVERGDQESLNRLDKKAKVQDAFRAIQYAREAGIKSSVYLLIGLPWDTEELLEAQLNFAKRLDPDVLEVFYPYPFPGTPLHALAIREGLIETDFIPKVAYSDPAMSGHNLDVTKLIEWRKRILKEFYLRPKIISRTLLGTKNVKEFSNYVRIGMQQLLNFT